MRAYFALISIAALGCAPATLPRLNEVRSFNVSQTSVCNSADRVTIKAEGAWQGNLDVWVIPAVDSTQPSPINNPYAVRLSTIQKEGNLYTASIQGNQVTASKNGAAGLYTIAVSDQRGASSSTALDVKSCQ